MSLQLFCIINKYHLSDAAYKELVAWANDLITTVARDHEVSPSVYFYQILSPYLTQELLKTLYPVQKREYDICKNGCHLYMADDLTRCPNTNCNSPRYREIDNKPYATMVYLPLSDQLATFIANPSTRNLLTSRSAITTSDEYHDIFDGNVIKSQNCWGNRDIILGLYVDVSLGVYLRYKDNNMIQLAIIPTASRAGNLDSFLAPVIEELKQLETVGIDVVCDDKEIHNYKARLVLAMGDIPGVASLAHYAGHMSIYGCRICLIKSERLESTQSYERRSNNPQAHIGYGRYFPGSQDLDPSRSISDFEEGDPIYGLNQSTPFAKLKSFHAPFFFGLDEMHLFGCNIGPSLWAMVTNQSLLAPYYLNKSQRTAISNAIQISRPTWPGIFDGRITDVVKSTKDTRAVDYIDSLLYVFPTIIIDQLEDNNCPTEAISALASLVKACALSLSWEITSTDIVVIEECIEVWHMFALNNMNHNLYTVNFHYLRHIPEALQQLGPMRAYGVRSMERAVGLFDKLIKSTKEPGKNADKQLELLAANRFHSRTNHQEILLDSNADNNNNSQHRKAVYVDATDGAPELWGPHLKDTTINEFITYNLILYLQKFWARMRNMQPSSPPPLLQDITVGKRLFLNGDTYDCKLLSGTEKSGSFLKLSLPVDKNAHGGLGSEVRLEYKDFFGEAILFFTHRYMSDERILCLVDIAQGVKLTNYGYPFGKTTFGVSNNSTHHFYYVCDVSEIVCAVGVLKSPTKNNCYYYVYKDMMKQPINLGTSRNI
ncbi:hypothetical protein INT45_014171 [Circinella minor]|uniref:Uncharacterized protein n=1 Tax=Circinella minor TaxID=1195481 RepID=A0A8H7RIA6_9FUNG|nr:hypothetical protein INT45_014171 [Circinella minor]